MTDKYAVLGNPIAHSKSPMIHAAFAKQTKQDISYEAILAPLDGFTATVNDLIAQGYKGVNVTVPFKFEAYALADERQIHAQHAGAVNTLSFMDGQRIGSNTDGLGLVRDIEHNLQCAVNGKRVLLLGAGGAAEGVLLPLLDAQPNTLVVANRSVEKAIAMVGKVKALEAYQSIQVAAMTFQELHNSFDIIINATSTGLSDVALPIPHTVFAKGCLAYDMMYGRETPFMTQARDAGAQVADGLGMLIEQAAEAFYLWRGIRPDTQLVIQQVRAL